MRLKSCARAAPPEMRAGDASPCRKVGAKTRDKGDRGRRGRRSDHHDVNSSGCSAHQSRNLGVVATWPGTVNTHLCLRRGLVHSFHYGLLSVRVGQLDLTGRPGHGSPVRCRGPFERRRRPARCRAYASVLLGVCAPEVTKRYCRSRTVLRSECGRRLVLRRLLYALFEAWEWVKAHRHPAAHRHRSGVCSGGTSEGRSRRRSAGSPGQWQPTGRPH